MAGRDLLEWTSCGEDHRRGVGALDGLPQLEWLALDGTKVTDAGLGQLKVLPRARSVDPQKHRDLRQPRLEQLKELPQLRALFVQKTNITDAGLEQLKGPMQLKSLDLMYTKVTDAGLERLKDQAQLRSLYLTGTKITEPPRWTTLKACPRKLVRKCVDSTGGPAHLRRRHCIAASLVA